MTIPTALVNACERNPFVWLRASAEVVDTAFEQLCLPKSGQLYEFARRYCLQFASETLPFELMDFVEEDGGVSDNVFYAREELGVDPKMVPISPFEASSLHAVDTANDQVLLLIWSSDEEGWVAEIVGETFFAFMLEHLDQNV